GSRSSPRMLVVEGVADAERVRGEDLDPSRAAADVDRMRDDDASTRRRLGRPARGRQQRHERLGAAVAGGDLRAVDGDLEVVDAETGGGREQVLDRLNPRAVATDGGRVVRVDDALGRGGDRVDVAGNSENDTGVGRR